MADWYDEDGVAAWQARIRSQNVPYLQRTARRLCCTGQTEKFLAYTRAALAAELAQWTPAQGGIYPLGRMDQRGEPIGSSFPDCRRRRCVLEWEETEPHVMIWYHRGAPPTETLRLDLREPALQDVAEVMRRERAWARHIHQTFMAEEPT